MISLEQFQSINPNLKIKIASSDPQTNSLVRSFEAMSNVEFKSLQDNEIIAIMGDNKHIVVGILQESSSEPLNNCIGFGSNYKPLISIFIPIFKRIWASIPKTPTYRPHPSVSAPHVTIKQTISSMPQQPKSRIDFTSSIQPREGDEVGDVLNKKFNSLLKQLNTINGKELGSELKDIVDFILETKGYSVTLHSVRSYINSYKASIHLLTDEEKNNTFEAIESWKQRLF